MGPAPTLTKRRSQRHSFATNDHFEHIVRPPAEQPVSIRQQARPGDDKHICASERPNSLKPPVKLAWYPHDNPAHQPSHRIAQAPGLTDHRFNWKSCDVVSGRDGFRAGADTCDFSIRYETVQMVENCLKSALVAKVIVPKVPKQANSRPCFTCFHVGHMCPAVSTYKALHSATSPEALTHTMSVIRNDTRPHNVYQHLFLTVWSTDLHRVRVVKERCGVHYTV